MIENNIEKENKKTKENKKEIETNTINDEDLDKFDEEVGNESRFLLIIKFIKNFKFKIGSDITNVPIPSIFIEPKSTINTFTEHFYNSFDLALKANEINDELERMCQVHRYTISTLAHYSVLDKPLNAILGETFIGNFISKDSNGKDSEDNFFYSEQISHHPPIQATCIYNKKLGVKVNFSLQPQGLFMGSCFKVFLEGKIFITLENHNEIYQFTIPTLFARFIRGFTEHVGDIELTSNKSKYKIVSKFQSKPLIGGDYDYNISKIINTETNEQLHSVYGKWSGEMKIKNLKTNETKQYYKKSDSSIVKLNEDRSLETDTYNIWKEVYNAHNDGNNRLKSLEKRKVENHQRQLAIERKNNNTTWKSKFFFKKDDSDFYELINYN